MKLLMISGDRSLAEGKRGAFYNTLEEFHKYWDRVDVICPRISSKWLTANSNFFGNVFVHPSPWPLIFQPFWILQAGLRILKTNNYKLETRNYLMTVHEYPLFYNGIGARLLWQRIRVPYVLEIHHVPGYPRAVDFKEGLYKIATQFFIKYDVARAVAVRVVNQHQVSRFLIKAGVLAEKIKYIPSAYIDLETFRPISVEKKYDLVFAARLDKNKGVCNLVEAVKIVVQTKPDIKLLIIGSGPELKKLKLQATSYKLQANIEFRGWLETSNDVAVAYNSARVFINPSLNEGGPRVALEVMACGLPVITTRVGAMLDIIKDGKNGLFVNWEPADMAEKILFLLGELELQKKFSQAGLELVRQFEKKSAIKNYAEKLQDVLKGK